ncbi:alpha/beta fold hydrolase [Niallia sp. Krafla_26]|uniref:alpha/beta fold hydrolase n=1 Tax=Niallia sp. Krafla_26 TaxID=3064703 RepID=UPI003D179F37
MKTLEAVDINGSQQWIYVRTKNEDKPILLFLHGGPGAAQIYCVDRYFEKLEEDFIVVDWDQRGSGKSYNKKSLNRKLTINQYVEDIKVLSQLLLKRFNKDKIFLVGHSWGTIIGLLAVEKYPELFQCYLGIGQVIDLEEGEGRGYDYALQQSKLYHHRSNYQTLVRLGSPPYPSLKKTAQFRKVLDQYGGFRYQQRMNLWNDIKEMITSKHYRIKDIYHWLKGIHYLTKHFRSEIVKINFKEQVKKVEIPVYFLTGQFDYITPYSLVEEYMEIIDSPYKKLIIIENTAHDVHFEKPDPFMEVCVNISLGIPL